jgi:beta-lactamase class A
MVLNALVNRDVFVKVFTDIGLPAPDFNARDYPISAKDYSRFFIELYNGSYLSFTDSEASMSLLNQVVFKEGMMKGIPASVPVCHKFGESGSDTEPHFSESGIVFVENKPYLLTIMLKGRDVNSLPGISADISSLVYRFVTQP